MPDKKIEQRRKETELIKRINVAEKYKKEIVDSVQELLRKYKEREISLYEYQEKLFELLQGKPAQIWLDYYNDYIAKCKKELDFCRKDIKKEKVKRLAFNFGPLILIGLLLLSTFGYFLFIKEPILLAPPENVYIQTLDFVAGGNDIYTWTLENPGDLNSVKLSGEIEGKGEAKVFLLNVNTGQEFLILDSASLQSTNGVTGRITGAVVGKGSESNSTIGNETNGTVIGNETNFTEPIVGNETNVTKPAVNDANVSLPSALRSFSDACVDTCDLSGFGLSEGSYELRVEITGDALLRLDFITYGILAEEVVVQPTQQEPLPAGVSVREIGDVAGRRRVIVSGPEGMKDVPVSVEVPELIKVSDKGWIKIYWVEEDIFMNFVANDIDNNGLIDSVSWKVPHLSNQTFDIIIEVTKAMHLDSNRNFLSDVTDNVTSLDGNWSEAIPSGDYVRATFASNLTSINDITIYPRIVLGKPKIEIYEKNGNEIIAEFAFINNNTYNTVYLDGLQGSQHTFDLRVLEGALEFDHIVDPPANPDGSNNVTRCGTLDSPGVYTMNKSITVTSGDCIKPGSDDIVFDGGGSKFNITFNSLISYAVFAKFRTNLTVRNLHTNYTITTGWAGGVSFSTITDSFITNNSFEVFNSAAPGYKGVFIASSNGISIKDNIFFVNSCGTCTAPVISIEDSFDNLIQNNDVSGGKFGISITNPTSPTPSSDNVLLNNRIYGNLNEEIRDVSGVTAINYLVYNNSFGEIRWTDDSNAGFLRNMDSEGIFSFPGSINITENSASLTPEMFPSGQINSSANITLYGLSALGFNVPAILKDGVDCNPSACYNFTSLVADTVIFNVTGFSNYSIGESTALMCGDVLDQENKVYTLTRNLQTSGDCLTITANNVTLDGDGYSITHTGGIGGTGIFAASQHNATINNVSINAFSFGVHFRYVEDSRVENTTIANGMDAIYLESSYRNVIINNNANDNLLGTGRGVYLHKNSDYNQIINNTLTGNVNGIHLLVFGVSHPEHNLVSGNTISSGSTYTGISVSGGTNNTFTDNVIGPIGMGISLVSSTVSENHFYNIDIFDNSNTAISISTSSGNLNFENITIDNSALNAIVLSLNSGNNINFTNVIVTNTAPSFNDIYFDNKQKDGIYFIDTHLGKYDFSSAGQNITFIDRGEGEIKFLEPITGNGNDLSFDVQIANNYTFVNSVQTGLDKSANITLYNMPQNFFFPGILRDGVECGASVCYNFTDLNAPTVKFNVTGFSSYEIGELPSAPVVSDISTIPSQSIVVKQDGGVKYVVFNVTVIDKNGVGDIDTVNATFSRKGVERTNSSCLSGMPNSLISANYSCAVGLWYFDDNGLWDVGATANDTANLQSAPYSETFTLKETAGVPETSGILNWISLLAGQTTPELADTNPFVINNTGNDEVTFIGSSNIKIMAKHLVGSPDNFYIIHASNFGVNEINQCGGEQLINNVDVIVDNAVLPPGNNSANLGQEELFFCAEQVPSGLPAQSYSATGVNSWEITFIFGFVSGWVSVIFALPLTIRRKRRKKKGKDGTATVLDVVDERLEELLGISDEDEINAGLEKLLAVVRDKKLKKKIEEIEVPVSIFKEETSPAETLNKYLKENKGLRFSEIAEALARDQRTVWINYRNATRVKKRKIVVKEKKPVLVSVGIFKDRRFSVLESVVKYLREKGLRNVEVAAILERDPKNTFTLYARARKKLEKKG